MGAPTITDPPEMPSSVELLIAGSKFARYEIVRCVGVGGMGAVFEATHSLLRKRVALKALHATLGRSEASRARFLREAETVARIRHPNVVDISDVGVERAIPFLVMEYLEGEDLAYVLEREGKLDVTRAVDLLLPALAGLCAVHRLGIVHRDIKPENIFLAVDALGTVVPKLVDFGVSKNLDTSSVDGAPLRHTVAGTPFYMAPEQSRGSASLDGRADQYAMGVVLYQCLAQAKPFYSDSLLELLHMIDAGDYVPLQVHNPELPPPLVSLIARAMSRRIEDRFPTTEAFGQALSAFASDEVRTACARDFSAERRSVLPPSQRHLSDADLQRLSAPTRPGDSNEAPEPPALVTVEERPSKLSGVRARDTEPFTAAPAGARSRRAFVLAAGITLLLLLVLGVLLRDVTAPVSERAKVTAEPPRAAQKGTPVAPAGARPAPNVTGAGARPDSAPPSRPSSGRDNDAPRGRAKPKRDDANPTPLPVDIQLSR